MHYDFLYRTVPPWLYTLAASDPETAELAYSLEDHPTAKVVVRTLRGKRMKTDEQVFNEASAALQFPWYFGENWPAFDECIADLSWLPGDVYILIIAQANLVLPGDDEGFRILMRTLASAGQEWSTADPGWVKPVPAARPFHAILQSPRGHVASLEDRLRRTVPELAVGTIEPTQ
jgi:hypothetical protein